MERKVCIICSCEYMQLHSRHVSITRRYVCLHVHCTVCNDRCVNTWPQRQMRFSHPSLSMIWITHVNHTVTDNNHTIRYLLHLISHASVYVHTVCCISLHILWTGNNNWKKSGLYWTFIADASIDLLCKCWLSTLLLLGRDAWWSVCDHRYPIISEALKT